MAYSLYTFAIVIFGHFVAGRSAEQFLSHRQIPNPCAKISSSAAIQQAAATDSPILLSPSDVYACQQDVPLNKSIVLDHIASLKSYSQFQSTQAYLKNPPSTYQLPAVDLLGGLDSIAAKVAASAYRNEYEVEYDIFNLFSATGDGHCIITPYLIGSFRWVTEVNLISVSPDGIQEPAVYFRDDFAAAIAQNMTPSALTAVNGIAIDEYLSKVAFYAPFQDLDAKYNFMLYNPATTYSFSFNQTSNYFQSIRSVYHDDTSVYSFSNGTDVHRSVYAVPVDIAIDFKSGPEFFSKHLATQPISSTPTNSFVTDQLPGYPYPVMSQAGFFQSSYFLDSDGLTDTAVLSIPSFDAYGSEAQGIQNMTRNFFALCKKEGKSRLIIDVRGNGGGNLGLGRDLFQQLFPAGVADSGIRWRISAAADFIGTQLSRNPDLPALSNLTADETSAYESAFRAEDSIDPTTNSTFRSWRTLAPPLFVYGDNFTRVAMWDVGSPILDNEIGIVPSGSGNNTSLLPQPFAAENITIITDGACGSTCADFVYTLTREGNIRTVVAGGRPSNSPMNLVGGVRGAQVNTFAEVQSWAKIAYALATQEERAVANHTVQPLMQDTPLAMFGGMAAQHLNTRDNIAAGDADMVPLQFQSLYADCRIFYTAQDVQNVTYTWERVAAGVMKQGHGLCINGTVAKWSRASNASGTTPQSASGLVFRPMSWFFYVAVILALIHAW